MPETTSETEKVFFEEGAIKITDKRAIFGGATHVVANIASVAVAKQDPNGCLPATFGIVGAALLFPFVTNLQYGNYTEAVVYLVGCVGLLAAAFAIMRSAKPTFKLVFSTAAGQLNVYSSTDEDLVKKVAAAINDSIASK